MVEVYTDKASVERIRNVLALPGITIERPDRSEYGQFTGIESIAYERNGSIYTLYYEASEVIAASVEPV